MRVSVKGGVGIDVLVGGFVFNTDPQTIPDDTPDKIRQEIIGNSMLEIEDDEVIDQTNDAPNDNLKDELAAAHAEIVRLEGIVIKRDADDTGDAGKGDGVPTNKPEGDALLDGIRAAAETLKTKPTPNKFFTQTGLAKVPALEEILGYDITSAERDAALSP